MMNLRSVAASLLLLTSMPIQAKQDLARRSFKFGMIAMSPKLDRQKALGIADYAGWVATTDTVIGSVDDEWVVGYSLAKRAPQWWLRTGFPLTAPPAVFGNWVVVCGQDGSVRKVDYQTGKVAWNVTLPTFVVRSLVKEDALLLASGANQTLFALDFQTGATTWLHDPAQMENLMVREHPAPAVFQNRVFYGLSSGDLHVLDLTTGKPIWQQNPKITTGVRFHDYTGQMVANRGSLLISRYDGTVASITLPSDRSEVRFNWEKSLGAVATSAFRDGVYYVGTSAGEIFAYDADSGKELWKYALGKSISTIAPGEKSVFVTSFEGHILTFENQRGELLWHDHLGGTIVSPPFFTRDAVIFNTAAKNFYFYKK